MVARAARSVEGDHAGGWRDVRPVDQGAPEKAPVFEIRQETHWVSTSNPGLAEVEELAGGGDH
jgi:hypothetical protein